MDKFEKLYIILSEELELYNEFIDIEQKKYDAIVKDDINSINKIVSQEQAYFLKLKGLELKREQIFSDSLYKDKTLKEIIEYTDGDQNKKFIELHKKISSTLIDFKRINAQCQILAEIRLHKVQNILSHSEHKDTRITYNNSGAKENNKTNLVSRKF